MVDFFTAFFGPQNITMEIFFPHWIKYFRTNHFVFQFSKTRLCRHYMYFALMVTDQNSVNTCDPSGGPKRAKYRNTEYRSLGILTEPNRIIPNRISQYMKIRVYSCFPNFIAFLYNIFQIFVVTRFQWLFWFRKNVEILKIVIFLSKNGLKDP